MLSLLPDEVWIHHPLYHLLQMLQELRTCFRRPEPYRRTCLLLLGELFAFARKTITQLLCAIGMHLTDWTNWYRLLESGWQPSPMFAFILRQTLRHVAADEPYIVVADGTHVPRTGKKIPGAYWSPDKRNAPFDRGLCWSQRIAVLGWLTPLERGFARWVCLGVWCAFSPQSQRAKPGSCCSETGAWLSALFWLREQLDSVGRGKQWIGCITDGSGDSKHFAAAPLPHHTWVCVRIRRDACLRSLPQPQPKGRGRRRVYGEGRFRPEQIWHQRRGWRAIEFEVRGRQVRCEVRVEGPCRRQGWGESTFFVIVVRGHRERRGGKYRAPMAFLVSALAGEDGSWRLPLGVEHIVSLLWQRWEVEVGIRVLKSEVGLGQKQCWGLERAERSLAWSGWVYSLWMLSGYRAWGVCGGERRVRAWYRGGGRWGIREVVGALREGVWQVVQKIVLDGLIVGEGQKKEGLLSRVWRAWLGSFRL